MSLWNIILRHQEEGASEETEEAPVDRRRMPVTENVLSLSATSLQHQGQCLPPSPDRGAESQSPSPLPRHWCYEKRRSVSSPDLAPTPTSVPPKKDKGQIRKGRSGGPLSPTQLSCRGAQAWTAAKRKLQQAGAEDIGPWRWSFPLVPPTRARVLHSPLFRGRGPLIQGHMPTPAPSASPSF